MSNLKPQNHKNHTRTQTLQDFWSIVFNASDGADLEVAIGLVVTDGADEIFSSAFQEAVREVNNPVVRNSENVFSVNSVTKNEGTFIFSAASEDSSDGVTTEHSVSFEFELIDGEYVVTSAFSVG